MHFLFLLQHLEQFLIYRRFFRLIKYLIYHENLKVHLQTILFFYPAKLLGAYGDAGILATDSEEMAEMVRLLRNHGQKTKTDIICFGWNRK